ncbi:AbfB domain-containing protein [Streptomyces mirabilis]
MRRNRKPRIPDRKPCRVAAQQPVKEGQNPRPSGRGACQSFESRNYPGDFLRHYNYQLSRQPMVGTTQFRQDATFCAGTGKSGTGTSFASYNYPTRYLRHYKYNVYIASDGGSNTFDSTTSWTDDVSWAVTAPWAP